MSGLARALKFFLIAVIAALFVAFAVANRATVVISLFPFPYSAALPEFLLAIICFGFGAIVAGLVMSIRSLKVRHQLVMERKKTAALENQIKLQHHDATAPLILVHKA